MHRAQLDDIDIRMLRSQFERCFHPEKPSYFKEDMILAVARKKKSRKQKSSDFNCVVIGDNDENELHDFMADLNKNCHALSANLRFQILFHYKNAHWIAIDCRFDNNQFDFILIDPAIFGEGLKDIICAITEAIPDANVTYLALNEETKIQRCYSNCGTFSLDILFGLSRIHNLYELISSIASIPTDKWALMFRNEVARNQLKAMTLDDLPVELGCILRNTHSIDTLEKFTRKKCSSSHSLLLDYFRTHTIIKGEKKNNAGIDYKRRKIKSKLLSYYKTLTNKDIASLLNKNENFNQHLIDEELTQPQLKNIGIAK